MLRMRQFIVLICLIAFVGIPLFARAQGIKPGNKVSVEISKKSRVITISNSASRSATVRYKWVYGNNVQAVSGEFILKGQSGKTLNPPLTQSISGAKVSPRELIIKNVGETTIHAKRF